MMQKITVYEEPIMDVLYLEFADVVTLSTETTEPKDPDYEDVNNMFG